MFGIVEEGLAILASAADAVAPKDYETLTTANAPWAPIRFVDTELMPWSNLKVHGPEEAKFPFSAKPLFTHPVTKEHLMVLYVPPGWPGSYLEYHTYPEWGFNYSGDLPNNEATCPEGAIGPINSFKEGNFMDRPPYSLHGGERGYEFMRSQLGGAVYHLVAVGLNGKSYSPDPHSPNFNPKYTEIKSWTAPRIIDTIEQMPWERFKDIDGLYVKILADDPGRGFKARLWRLDPGWEAKQSPDFAHPYYLKQGYQFSFIVVGDLNVQAYKAPGEAAEMVSLKKHFHIEKPPMGILGLVASGPVTQLGCVWFEATYATGTSYSDTPIEEQYIS